METQPVPLNSYLIFLWLLLRVSGWALQPCFLWGSYPPQVALQAIVLSKMPVVFPMEMCFVWFRLMSHLLLPSFPAASCVFFSLGLGPLPLVYLALFSKQLTSSCSASQLSGPPGSHLPNPSSEPSFPVKSMRHTMLPVTTFPQTLIMPEETNKDSLITQ